MYLDADLTAKERALACTAPLGARPGRFRPGDTLLAFLTGL
jgi:integrase/recombinase XerD